ncbi:hypothetical protein [Neptunomonas japonica]|uniref:Uncharacterized protein n=1 Tax=Neptunomonas japonica JAMM 1380 TaxID=1441457 RepID=A0A7R6PTT7_9GAMM|nr:hypothetical protein [Neptunomonas japonica]BBB29338.1 conserved hypothetical protein [Neptunomonas japonica JAMM 1380]
MKITDENLLNAVWENQMRLLAKGVLHKYNGGFYGVVCDDEYWLFASMAEHMASRQRITDLIKKPHLRSRIARLILEKKIYSVYGKSLLTFCINSDHAKAAFKDARQFWLSSGVPEGYSEGKANVVSLPYFDVLADECESMLINKYGQRSV